MFRFRAPTVSLFRGDRFCFKLAAEIMYDNGYFDSIEAAQWAADFAKIPGLENKLRRMSKAEFMSFACGEYREHLAVCAKYSISEEDDQKINKISGFD